VGGKLRSRFGCANRTNGNKEIKKKGIKPIATIRARLDNKDDQRNDRKKKLREEGKITEFVEERKSEHFVFQTCRLMSISLPGERKREKERGQW